MVKNSEDKYEKALYYEIFNKEEYGFLKPNIQTAKTIFDIGWHVGFFSQWCRGLNKSATIYYFEPVTSLYNQALTRLWDDKAIIFSNYWIAAKTISSTILLNNEKSMQSSKYQSFLNPNWTPEKVNFKTLNEVIESNNINSIDVMKMDIEWMEFESLNALSQENREKIKCIAIEVHLLNDNLETERKGLSLKLSQEFTNITIFPSPYNDKIFLTYATKF